MERFQSGSGLELLNFKWNGWNFEWVLELSEIWSGFARLKSVWACYIIIIIIITCYALK